MKEITLEALPYAEDALAPTISARTVSFHYGKHHAGYVKTLNGLIAGTQYEGRTLEEIIRTAAARGDAAIFNNAAQNASETPNRSPSFRKVSIRPVASAATEPISSTPVTTIETNAYSGRIARSITQSPVPINAIKSSFSILQDKENVDRIVSSSSETMETISIVAINSPTIAAMVATSSRPFCFKSCTTTAARIPIPATLNSISMPIGTYHNSTASAAPQIAPIARNSFALLHAALLSFSDSASSAR